MSQMQNPYEDARAERIAIVNALELLEWLGYSTPPFRTGSALREAKWMLANELRIRVDEETERINAVRAEL
jgi:hypothetical protein